LKFLSKYVCNIVEFILLTVYVQIPLKLILVTRVMDMGCETKIPITLIYDPCGRVTFAQQTQGGTVIRDC